MPKKKFSSLTNVYPKFAYCQAGVTHFKCIPKCAVSKNHLNYDLKFECLKNFKMKAFIKIINFLILFLK